MGAPKFRREFRGRATKFVPSGSPVFAPDLGPTQRFIHVIANVQVILVTPHRR